MSQKQKRLRLRRANTRAITAINTQPATPKGEDTHKHCDDGQGTNNLPTERKAESPRYAEGTTLRQVRPGTGEGARGAGTERPFCRETFTPRLREGHPNYPSPRGMGVVGRGGWESWKGPGENQLGH